MGDIDFDELDKAVNSVMKQTPGAQPAADNNTVDQQSETTPDMTAPAELEQPQQVDQVIPEEAPASEPTQPALEATPTPEPTPAASPEDNTTTNFTSPTPEEAPTEPEQPANTDTPDVTPAPVEQTPAPDVPGEPAEETTTASATPQTDQTSSSDVKPIRRSGRFMDVVHPSSDMAAASNVPDTSPTTDRKGPTITPPSQPEATTSDTSPVEEETPAPKAPTTPPDTPEPDSPFLPDAKVEKRPLGPVTADAAQTDADQAVSQQSEATPDGSGGDTPSAGPLPDELKNELVSLDASEHAQPAQSTPAQPTGPNDQFQTPEQTTEQPEEHAAIFSPDAHAPLAHPKKKRSSVVVIAVIVGLILVGVIGATALYMLDVL